MKNYALILLFSFCCITTGFTQDPNRFSEEIEKFNALVSQPGNNVIFTGSSSIRMWENLSMDCEDMNPINTGFGGSHMSDLLHYINETVLRFKPKTVYIYEGDNDISAGKDPEDVMNTTKEVVDRILNHDQATKIIFISAKPSPSRWEYEKQYLVFNNLLKAYCDSHDKLSYIDVWVPMIGSNGRPMADIFIEDSLHMNRKGYLLWKDIICNSN